MHVFMPKRLRQVCSLGEVGLLTRSVCVCYFIIGLFLPFTIWSTKHVLINFCCLFCRLFYLLFRFFRFLLSFRPSSDNQPTNQPTTAFFFFSCILSSLVLLIYLPSVAIARSKTWL